MPSIYELKPKFQNLLRPLVNKLATMGITANQITILAVLLSFVTGGLIFVFSNQQWILLAIPIVLFIRMALNAIDGMLAREHNMQSSLGAILNELGDVLSDVALYLPLALIDGVNASWLILVVLFAVISEMTGVIAVQIGAHRRYDGPMGKSDRAFLFGSIGLALGMGFNPQPWMDYLLIAMFLLLCLTIFNRSHKALEEIR
ncbi:MAG: CDP-alcohol phosphatidyltransferase family protein [Thiomargarita sp.]|nr:CDP-alcohol phosphatidyltransferase family protein [Thiomargarita sp.]